MSETASLPTDWKYTECDLKISISGPKFQAVGKIEKPYVSAFVSALTGSQPGKSVEERIMFSGKVSGRAIFGRVVRSRIGEAPARRSLLSDDDGLKALMIVNKDGSEISVMERPDADPRYYTLTVSPIPDS